MWRDTVDPELRSQIENVERSLQEEFGGMIPWETIRTTVDSTVGRHSDARVTQYIPVFVHRTARAQLRSLAVQ